MSPAIDLQDVTVGYHGASPVLRDVTLTVGQGELVGVIGPSGSGKTTLLRLLTGRVKAYAGKSRVLAKTVRYNYPARGVGYVPQMGTADRSFPLTVEQAVLLGMSADGRRTPWFSSIEKSYAGELLDQLGIARHRDRLIGELSGGEYQRMLLARAMARHSELILLDEPTSGVDMQTRRDILGLLAELNAEGLTVVLTTHDLNWVAGYLPRLVCLHGSITGDGPPADVLTPDVLKATFGADMQVIADGGRLLIADREPIDMTEVSR